MSMLRPKIDAPCERCGGELALRSPWPLLLLPLLVGGVAVGAIVLMGRAFSVVERVLVVTALFVAFLLALNPLARRWLAVARCARCGARASG